jgi:hypothetical protein
MPIVNADVAAVFGEIADLLEVQGANAFRILGRGAIPPARAAKAGPRLAGAHAV